MTSLYEEIQIAIHGIWSRRWLALAVAWAIALVGWLVVALIPNTYQSRARIFVEARTILSDRPGTNPLQGQQELEQIRQTLTSADNLVEVVRGTDLARQVRTDADMGVKVGMLKRDITVVSQQDNLFEISATSADRGLSDGENARLSSQIVNRLIDVLARENLTGNKADTERTLQILDAQIAARSKELQAADQRRVAFAQRNVGLLPGVGSISQRMDAMRTELGQIDQQLVGAESAMAGINGQLAQTPPTIDTPGFGGGGGGNPQGGALAQAMGELAAARARGWTDSHPDVVALRRQIAALRSMGAGGGSAGPAMTRTPNPAYVQLRSLQTERSAAVAALRSRRAQLEAALAGMADKQAQEPGVASQQDRLDRDYDAVKAQFDKLVADREETQLRGDVRSEAGAFSFRLIDPPGVPSAPASPNRPLLLAAVLVAALAAGAGVAFALSQMHTTYATAVRLERATGLPVIGSITETLGATAITERRRKLRLFAGAAAGLVLMCAALVVLEFAQRGMSA